jgi:hypothetical protein
MDLATLDIDVEQAKAGLKEYTTLIEAERTAEDNAIVSAYRAAARGLSVISLSAAITAGGFFENGLPRIAVCRADARTCLVQRSWYGNELTFYDQDADTWRRYTALVGGHTVKVRVSLPEPVNQKTRTNATTVVPPIPPRFRPKRARLASHHILWEVEKWDLTPPHDPALLRHIRGDLWAVLATWDLTDIERHVLAQRSHARG